MEANESSEVGSPTAEVLEKPGPSPSDEKVSRELRRVSNDNTVKELIAGYDSSLVLAEETALNYLCNEIHHPVIPSFRDLTKTEFNTIFGSSKYKKKFTQFELGVLCLGMTDYLAVGTSNPLYSENHKTFVKTKGISAYVERVLSDFGPLLIHWGSNDVKLYQGRYDHLMTYLKRLAPYFQSIDFDKTFLSMLDAIEFDVLKRKLKVHDQVVKLGITPQHGSESSEREALSELQLNKIGRSDIDEQKKVMDPTTTTGTYNEKSIGSEKSLAHKVDDQVKGSNPILSNSKPVATPKWTKPKKSRLTFKRKNNTQSSSSAVGNSKIPTTKDKNNPVVVDLDCSPQKKSRIEESNGSSEKQPRIQESKPKGNKTPSVVELECPPEKKPRIQEPKPVTPECSKNKVNAFTVLMNRSRELAKAGKSQKASPK